MIFSSSSAENRIVTVSLLASINCNTICSNILGDNIKLEMTDNFDLAMMALRIIEKSMSKPKTRRSFPNPTKKITLSEQKNKCNHCDRKSKIWDFDHIDGDSSNNSLSNCQALCPNCHAKKTRKIKNRNVKLSQILRKIKKYLR